MLGNNRQIQAFNFVLLIMMVVLFRSPAMKKISLGMLCDLLKFGLERMEALNGVRLFIYLSQNLFFLCSSLGHRL